MSATQAIERPFGISVFGQRLRVRNRALSCSSSACLAWLPTQQTRSAGLAKACTRHGPFSQRRMWRTYMSNAFETGSISVGAAVLVAYEIE